MSEVDDWFASYDNSVKEPRLRVRDHPGGRVHVREHQVEDAHVRVRRQHGEHPRLLGRGDTARSMTFTDLADVEAAADELRAVTAAWIARKS
jgi:hypothetical protein